MRTPDVPRPEPVVERSASRMPDGAAVKSNTARRTEDRIRAGTDTILTSGSGVTQSAMTQGKTLLGQ